MKSEKKRKIRILEHRSDFVRTYSVIVVFDDVTLLSICWNLARRFEQLKLSCRCERALQRLAVVIFVPPNSVNVAYMTLAIMVFSVLLVYISSYHCEICLFYSTVAMVRLRLPSSEIWRIILKLNVELSRYPTLTWCLSLCDSAQISRCNFTSPKTRMMGLSDGKDLERDLSMWRTGGRTDGRNFHGMP